MHIRSISIALALVAASVQAEDAPKKAAADSLQLSSTWAVSLDASGHVVKAESIDDVITAVRDPLAREIQRWQFVPGKIDGQGAPTDTTLTLALTLAGDGFDKYRIRIDDAKTGGRADKMTAPRLPGEAIRKGLQGIVVVRVAYDANGKVLSAAPQEGAPDVAPMLSKSAIESVKHWTFKPETVGGHAIAGTAVLPLCFTVSKSAVTPPKVACEWRPPNASPNAWGGLTSMEPAARLATDVVGRTL